MVIFRAGLGKSPRKAKAGYGPDYIRTNVSRHRGKRVGITSFMCRELFKKKQASAEASAD